MKKIQVLLIALAFILLCINVFGEAMFDDTDWYNQQLAPFMK